MKNIHLIPTDKPSRLSKFVNQLYFFKETEVKGLIDQHIYITSDEKLPYDSSIFDNGAFYHIDAAGDVHIITKHTFKPNPNFCKKIILTTDQDLIKDGVQTIDDEFLEWFIKNPSCEWVDVKYQYWEGRYTYKISIPKQLPTVTMEEFIKELDEKFPIQEPKHKYEYIGECKGNNNNGCFLDSSGHNCGCFIRVLKEEPKQHIDLINDNIEEFDTKLEQFKQETLEEAAERLSLEKYPEEFRVDDGCNYPQQEWDINKTDRTIYKKGFINGAKLQAERSQIIVPPDATNIEVFAIKPDKNGKLFAYIGYKISNGNFHFSAVPFTEPKPKILYSEEDMIEYSDYCLMCSAEKTLKIPVLPKEWFEQFKKK